MRDLERLRRARALFEALVDGVREEADAARAQLAAADDELRGYVERLLDADARREVLGTDAGLTDVVERAFRAEVLPEQVGGFRVVGELGRGGMGVVYDAWQDVPRRRVALKTLHPWAPEAVRARLRSMFALEVEAMGRVLHPGIPQIYQVFDADGVPVMVMERVVGRPLVEAVASVPLSARVDLLARIADAVAHAHAAGVVHRDLKPGNVLVTGEGQPKVLDFGVARLGETGEVGVGTQGFMAPEQAPGEVGDARVDVYGLGRLGAVVCGSDDLPRPLRAVLQRATAAAADDRYPSATALAADLRRYLDGKPVVALAGSPREVVTALWRRRRRQVAAGLVVATLTLGVGVATLGAWRSAEQARASSSASDELAGLIADAAARGPEHPEVVAAWEAFVAEPRHANTAAWSDAWAWRGRHATDEAEARYRLAVAWAGAVDEAQARLALRALADRLVAAGDGAALVGVVAALGPTTGAAEEAPARRLAALWRWDVDEARAHADGWGPWLDLLATARPDPEVAVDGVVGDDGSRWAVVGQRLVAWGADDTIVYDGVVPPGNLLGAGGGGLWWAAPDGADGKRQVLWLGADGELRRVEPIGDDGIAGHLWADADGDGVGERYVGGGPPGVVRVADPADGASRVLHTPGGAGHTGALAVGDLDGDGISELIVGRQGWRGQDLRVLRGLPERAELVARLRMAVADLAVVPSVSGSELLAVGRAGHVLPVQPPGTAPAPLWLVSASLGADGLVVGATQRLPARLDELLVADLDRDGRRDVVVSGDGLVFGRGRPDGGFDFLQVPELRALGVVAGVDGPTLWVTGRGGSWRLGAGGEGLPTATGAERWRGMVPGAVVGPAAVAWARGEAIAAAGLEREASHVFEALSRRAGPVGEAAAVRALELLRGLDLDRATAIAERLWAQPRRSSSATASAREVLALAHREPDRVHRALPASGVRVVAPEAVAYDAGREAWTLDLHTGRGDVLAVPVHWEGGGLDVVMDVELLEQDWGAGFVVELRLPSGALLATVIRGGGGPADQHGQGIHCGPETPGVTTVRSERHRLGVHTLRLSWRRGPDTLRCGWDGLSGGGAPVGLPSAGDGVLVVRPSDPLGPGSYGRTLLRISRWTVGDLALRPVGPAGSGSLAEVLGGLRQGAGLPGGLRDDDLRFLLRADADVAARALARDPSLQRVFLDVWDAAIHFRTPEATAALRRLDPSRIAADDPDGRALLRAIATAHLDSGEPASAATVMERLDADADLPTLLLAARVRERAGDADAAVEALRRAVALDPVDQAAFDGLRDDPRLATLLERAGVRPVPLIRPDGGR